MCKIIMLYYYNNDLLLLTIGLWVKGEVLLLNVTQIIKISLEQLTTSIVFTHVFVFFNCLIIYIIMYFVCLFVRVAG